MKRKRLIRMSSFALPIAIVLVLMAVLRVYPFGDNTFLIWDMDWQYSSFFAHLHDILHGNASPWYSFSRAIGGDMVGVSAYYLISPFNLLFYFFDAEHIYAGIALVLLLKIGCTGWTMHYYLETKKEMAGNIIFSTAYALSGFMAAYFFNIIWLDGVLVLPLMVAGIERLVKEKKYLLYTISIAFGVMTSFYMGYMLCIFSVLYFLCYYFFLSEQKKKISTVFLYAGSSLLGGMLSAATALPALYAMRDGKTSIDLDVLHNHSAMFALTDFVGKKLCRNDRAFADHRGRAAFVRGGIVSTFPAHFFLRPELFVEKENWLWNFTTCDGSIALLLQSVLCLAGIQHAEWFPVPLCVSLCVCGVDHCGRGIPKTGGTQCIYAGRIVACDRSRCSQRQPVGIR